MFTLNAHGQVSYRFPLQNLLLRLPRRKNWKRLCHKYVQLYLHALCCDSRVPGAIMARFYPNALLCTKQGPFPSATPQSLKALACVCSLITANQGKHTLQSGMTSIYTAVCKLFQCQRRKQKILCMKCLVVQDIYTL